MKLCLYVTLKEDVLDPQGKVIKSALNNLGFNNINEVRQSKVFEISISQAKDFSEAKKQLVSMAEKLLANTVIEDYYIGKNDFRT